MPPPVLVAASALCLASAVSLADGHTIWQERHGAWCVFQESLQVGANSRVVCSMETARPRGRPEQIRFALVPGTGILVLVLLDPPVPAERAERPWMSLMAGRRFETTPRRPVPAEGGHLLHPAVVATGRDEVVPFMQAVASAAVLVLRFLGHPDLRIAAPGGRRAVQAFSECMQRHPPA